MAIDYEAQARAEVAAMEADWQKAWLASDPARITSFFAEDGIAMFTGLTIRGRENILALVEAYCSDPAFSLKFGVERLDMARSCDLAVMVGTFVTQHRPRNIGNYYNDWRNYSHICQGE
ncbi:YybH family protein [Sphingomonas oligophenolica]|uniref:Nuclear transport factor 2 family protein n=1 Tax=Sphingomonas oligophenolica TaxID=301154 RepID=A0A502CS07_9SPHN|nr:SgcJ/EcaC family oxidoreductase [Sphingomonas oligophenolica]TPG15454.1 nuclear transport factor 2 family protein [Sphingomonas oligophenolica]